MASTRAFLAVAVLSWLVGCVPELVWTGKTEDQFVTDRGQCSLLSLHAGGFVGAPIQVQPDPGAPTWPPAVPIFRVPNAQVFQSCMEARGYRLVPKPEDRHADD